VEDRSWHRGEYPGAGSTLPQGEPDTSFGIQDLYRVNLWIDNQILGCFFLWLGEVQWVQKVGCFLFPSFFFFFSICKHAVKTKSDRSTLFALIAVEEVDTVGD